MISVLCRSWWLVLARGVVAILFGVAAYAWRDLTLTVFARIVGSYALIDGALILTIGLLAAGERKRAWPLVLAGVLGIVFGLVSFVRPGDVAQALVYILAIWAIATGLLQIIGAVELRHIVEGDWSVALVGVVSMTFGALVLSQPATGNATQPIGGTNLVYLFGVYAILSGVLSAAFGIRLYIDEDLRSASSGGVPVAGGVHGPLQ